MDEKLPVISTTSVQKDFGRAPNIPKLHAIVHEV